MSGPVYAGPVLIAIPLFLFIHQFEIPLLPLADGRNSLFHPFRHRVSLEIVVEELLEPLCDILTVLAGTDIVGLAICIAASTPDAAVCAKP